MSYNQKDNILSFAQYLPSMVKLEELQKMTQDLEQELVESQKVMKEIKCMFDDVSKINDIKQHNNNKIDNLQHENLSKFLDKDVPILLMPDMTENPLEVVDLDDIVATMKNYAETLKKKFMTVQPKSPYTQRELENMDLEQYANTLDQLAKRLANIKLNKRDEVNNRNAELETKLTQLCEDVNMFTQMVETKTSISECNKNWNNNQQSTQAFGYENIVNKLLSGINEVIYLLKNKN